jgi:DNA primase
LKLKKGFKRVAKSDIRQKKIEATDCKKIVDLPETKSFDDNLSPIGERAMQYLKSRGIYDKHIEKYDLRYSDTKKCSKCHGDGYTDDEDQCSMCNGTGMNFFYSRIIIPSYENGNLVYLQGRIIKDGGNELRYQNIKAPRLQVLFFNDLLRDGDDIFITEGPIDAMTLYDYSATALLNTKISDPQITKILRKNPRRIIFVPDYDETIAKRDRINKAMSDNMLKIMQQSDYKIPLGVYEWHKMLNDKGQTIKKDINANQITYVDEDYILMYDQLRLKSATIRKEERNPYLDDGE